MSKYADGEVLELYWEDSVEQFYVKGHMAPEEAKAAFDKSYLGDDYRVSEFRPGYGRWSCNSWSECDHVLAVYDEPGRGRFPIMIADVLPDAPVVHDTATPETPSA